MQIPVSSDSVTYVTTAKPDLRRQTNAANDILLLCAGELTYGQGGRRCTLPDHSWSW